MGEKYQNGSSNPVSMGKAFKLFWTNYVNFKGTSSRSEYWWWYLWNVIIHLPLPMIGIIVLKLMINNPGSLGFFLLFSFANGVLNLAMVLPSLGLTMRRLRDAGLSTSTIILIWIAEVLLIILSIFGSTWFLIPLIAIGIYCFVMNLMPSSTKFNQ